MGKKCKVCNENYSLESYVKNVARCSKCSSIFTINKTNEQYPQIVTTDNLIKLNLQKKFAKLIAESYFKYIKFKTGLSFKKGLDVGGVWLFCRLFKQAWC